MRHTTRVPLRRADSSTAKFTLSSRGRTLRRVEYRTRRSLASAFLLILSSAAPVLAAGCLDDGDPLPVLARDAGRRDTGTTTTGDGSVDAAADARVDATVTPSDAGDDASPNAAHAADAATDSGAEPDAHDAGATADASDAAPTPDAGNDAATSTDAAAPADAAAE